MKKRNRLLILKVTVSFLIFSLVFLHAGISQSTITKRVINGQYAKHTIDNLVILPLSPDQYNLAVNDQLGVIGNNFFGSHPLTEIKNDNDYEKTFTPTDYFTVYRPGSKMTFCGKVLQQEINDGIVDDDLNIQIVCNPKNPAFASKYTQIKNRGYNSYSWAMIEGEIDVDDGFHKFFNPNNNNYRFPVINNTDVCLYGPWVEEIYDGSEDLNPNKDHANVHEIHPAEQFWWVEETQAGFRYYLNAANDASGRFGESNWTSAESKNIFAIAFDINKKLTDKIIYQIVNVCNQGTTAPTADGKKHYLILGTDTLMQVEEPPGADILSVSFAEVGLDSYSLLKDISDSTIKGFLVLQSTIKNQPQRFAHGNLKLQVDKKRIAKAEFAQLTATPILQVDKKGITKAKSATLKSAPPILQGTAVGTSVYKTVKITLKEITTLENTFKSGWIPGSFHLTGYIYVEKGTDNLPFSKSADKILEDKPQLLFPLSPDKVNNRVIRHDLGLTGVGIKKSTYEKSVYLNISPNEKINIITDFVAGYAGSSITTLELIDQAPFYELKIGLSELQKNIPITKEIILDNRNGVSKYKMKIKIEFLLMEEQKIFSKTPVNVIH